MVWLASIGPDNWREELAVREGQRRFVSDPNRLLARAYAYREQGAQAKLILNDGTPVGMLLYHDWPEAERYVFSQLLIDGRYQRQGFGLEAGWPWRRCAPTGGTPRSACATWRGTSPPGYCMGSWALPTPARRRKTRSSWN